MYAVIETKENTSLFVKLVNNEDEFLGFVKKSLGTTTFTEKKGVNFEDLQKDTKLVPGKYLLQTENKIVLAEKFVTLSRGYVYNSNLVDHKIVCTWNMYMNVSDDSNKGRIFDFSSFDLENIKENTIIGVFETKPAKRQQLIMNILDKFKSDKEFMSNTLILANNDNIVKYKEKYESSKGLVNYEHVYAEQYLRSRKANKNTKKGAIIFDDVLTPLKIKSSHVSDLLTQNNVYNKLVIFAFSSVPNLPDDLRANFDYIFLGEDTMNSTQKRIFDGYAKIFNTFKAFKANLLNVTTNNGHLLIVNKAANDSELTKKIFTYQIQS